MGGACEQIPGHVFQRDLSLWGLVGRASFRPSGGQPSDSPRAAGVKHCMARHCAARCVRHSAALVL
eukprot:4807505-Pyramimonas_sp.AAC.2